MATTAADPVFVDTNILIYSRQLLSPFHAAAQAKLRDLGAAGHVFWISRQTLREYLAAMSRPGGLTVPVPLSVLLADVQSFAVRFPIAEDSAAVTAQLLNLLASVSCGGKQIYDANIVATMQVHGIAKLLTHNVADFKRFSAYITVLPLVP